MLASALRTHPEPATDWLGIGKPKPQEGRATGDRDRNRKPMLGGRGGVELLLIRTLRNQFHLEALTSMEQGFQDAVVSRCSMM